MFFVIYRAAAASRAAVHADTASRERSSRLASARSPERKRSVFECTPYICPEPVLVKRSFLYINGFRKAIFAHRPQTCIIIHHDRNNENIDDPLKSVRVSGKTISQSAATSASVAREGGSYLGGRVEAI
jgi:hypothetical protein